MKRIRDLAFLMMLGSLAKGQIHSGTVIVVGLFEDKFVIAADSRAIFKDQPGRPIDDSSCKISAFKNGVVFTTANAEAYSDPSGRVAGWDNADEAGRVARLHPATAGKSAADSVETIADRWAQTIKTHWNSLYLRTPQTVIHATEHGNGFITCGIFAESRSGEIAATSRDLYFVSDSADHFKIVPVYINVGGIRAVGRTDVINEFFHTTSKRAKDEREKWITQHNTSGSMLRPNWIDLSFLVRLIELTIKYDSSGEVGGKIDVLELQKDGAIHWVKRKANCSETYK